MGGLSKHGLTVSSEKQEKPPLVLSIQNDTQNISSNRAPGAVGPGFEGFAK